MMRTYNKAHPHARVISLTAADVVYCLPTSGMGKLL